MVGQSFPGFNVFYEYLIPIGARFGNLIDEEFAIVGYFSVSQSGCSVSCQRIWIEQKYTFGSAARSAVVYSTLWFCNPLFLKKKNLPASLNGVPYFG